MTWEAETLRKLNKNLENAGDVEKDNAAYTSLLVGEVLSFAVAKDLERAVEEIKTNTRDISSKFYRAGYMVGCGEASPEKPFDRLPNRSDHLPDGAVFDSSNGKQP